MLWIQILGWVEHSESLVPTQCPWGFFLCLNTQETKIKTDDGQNYNCKHILNNSLLSFPVFLRYLSLGGHCSVRLGNSVSLSFSLSSRDTSWISCLFVNDFSRIICLFSAVLIGSLPSLHSVVSSGIHLGCHDLRTMTTCSANAGSRVPVCSKAES